MAEFTRLAHRRRIWAWTGWGCLAWSVIVFFTIGAATDTVRLHRDVKAARVAKPVSPWSRLLWALEAVRMLIMLAFIVYFVIVQAEAIAYLAGDRNTDFAGTSPPISINGDGSAVADILLALLWEVIFGLIFLIAGLFIHSWIKDKQQASRTRA